MFTRPSQVKVPEEDDDTIENLDDQSMLDNSGFEN